MKPKHPEIEVQLSGTNGNAIAIATRVRTALRKAGHRDEAEEFFEDALSGDYDHVIQTAMKWVDVS